MRKPYFKKSHQCWYVTDPKTRKEVRLDPDESVAHDIWQRMRDAQSELGATVTYRRLAEEWLAEHFEDRPRFTQDARYIAGFVAFVGDKQVRNLKQQDVVKWLNEEKPGQRLRNKSTDKNADKWVENPKKIKWSATTKRDAYAAIKRVAQWGFTEGHVAKNPIAKVKIDPPESREAVVEPEQFAALLSNTDPQFRNFLIACSTGARPRQVREVTAANVSRDGQAWLFAKHKTAHKTKKHLTIFLPPCMQTLTQILSAAYPTGPLFRNSNGEPWRKDVVVRKFARLRDSLGLPKDITCYSLRHTFGTNAILAGCSLQTVAQLMGHTDARMVSRVYSHLEKHPEFLLNAAASAFAKRAEPLQHRKPKAE